MSLNVLHNSLNNWKFIFLVLVPILLLPLLFIQDEDTISAPGKPDRPSTKYKCIYLLLLMGFYWVSDAIPLVVTGLLPLVFLPLFSIQDTSSVALNYMKESNMMLMGGIIIAHSVEFSNLHRRIALKVLTIIGSSPRRLLFGIMLTTMVLSMWISNTVTTAMMVPICLAVLQELRNETSDKDEPDKSNNAQQLDDNAFLFAIGYSSNIGGTGVLTGTPTNLILMGLLKDQGVGQQLTFATWMAYAVPAMLINTIITWCYLVVVFLGIPCRNEDAEFEKSNLAAKRLLLKKYTELGEISFHEVAVIVLYLAAVMLWLFRDPRFISGWAETIQHVSIADTTPAFLIVVLLFIIPKDLSSFRGGPNGALLNWEFVQSHMPWGIIIFYGGGFALADGAEVSGLSSWLGDKLNGLSSLDERVLLLIVMITTTFTTEVISNGAVASIMLPILLNLSTRLNLHPLFLTLPATVSCSFAFMLPAGSPTIAIVHEAAQGRMRIIDMVKTGAFLNIICILVLFGLNISYGNVLFDYNGNVYTNTTGGIKH